MLSGDMRLQSVFTWIVRATVVTIVSRCHYVFGFNMLCHVTLRP